MRKRLVLAALLTLATTPAFSIPPLVGPPIDPCPMNYEPVRCSDGIIYGNSCHAATSGATGCTPVPFWEW
jgi:hypothetical protein